MGKGINCGISRQWDTILHVKKWAIKHVRDTEEILDIFLGEMSWSKRKDHNTVWF